MPCPAWPNPTHPLTHSSSLFYARWVDGLSPVSSANAAGLEEERGEKKKLAVDGVFSVRVGLDVCLFFVWGLGV